MIVVFVIAMSACGSRPETPEVKTAVEPKAPHPDQSNEVRLDAAAQREAGIETGVVERQALPEVLLAPGRVTLNENQSWRVGAVTDGRVVRVLVNAGDHVKRGQVLARMHSHDIHESRALYRKATAELSRLKSAEAYAVRQRDRAKRLFEIKAGSLEQAEHAETALRNLQTEISNAQIEVERSRTHLVEFLGIPADEAEHLDGQHEEDDDLIPIKSPADGVLLERKVTAGTVTQPGADAFVVTDLSVLWLMAAVPEDHLKDVRPGMPVRVTVQAYPKRGFLGRVTRIGEQLDETTRTVKVRVDLPNAAGLLKPEMYATAELSLGATHPALFVKEAAIQEVKGQNVVFVRKAADLFEARAVDLGRPLDGAREVLSGLRAGERVATRGSFILKSQLMKSSMAEE